MKFGGIGVPELLIILAVALLIFGPKNLPKLGSALGKTVKNLRDGMGGGNKAVEEAEDEEIVEEVVEEKPAPKKTTAHKPTAEKTTKSDE
ncbi:MAG: twin-arginine translocase TatA/TatE family subunit [Raoultibacter sp.]